MGRYRKIFDNKSDRLKREARDIWRDADEGKISADDARNIITTLAGGFTMPRWMD